MKPFTQHDAEIARLRAELKVHRLLTQGYSECLSNLISAVARDAAHVLSLHRAPVYASKSGFGCTLVVTPSAKKQGYFQVTRYSSKGALGDSQYPTLQALTSSEGLASGHIRLGEEESRQKLRELMEAEMDYQSARKSAAAEFA